VGFRHESRVNITKVQCICHLASNTIHLVDKTVMLICKICGHMT